MNQRELLQNLQDTYAEKLQLTIIMTDTYGNAITSFSHLTSVVEYTISSINRHDKERLIQSDWMKKLQNPILIDSQNLSPYIGMKIIVAPIRIGDEHQYYLWAGNFVEEGYKPFALQSFQQNKLINIDKVACDLLELSISQVSEKIQTVSNMAMAITEFMTGYHTKEKLSTIGDVLTKCNREQSIFNRYSLLLKAIVDVEKNIDSIVFAKSCGNNQFKVVSAEGNCKNLSSEIITIGQTIAEECMERKNYGIWRKVDHFDDFFIHDGSFSLTSIFCFPIIVEQQVMAILIGGSETKDAPFSNLIQHGRVLIETMTAFLQTDLAKETLDGHLMKMSTLLDMNRVLEMAANEEELLRVLADYVLMFIPSDFCRIALKNGKSTQKIKKDSAQSKELMSFQQIECIHEIKNRPNLIDTKWGTVLNYPIYYREELLGLMTVHLQDLSAIKEAEVYMANLVNNSAIAINNLGVHKSEYVEPIYLGKESALDVLTSRELDVLRLLIKGNNNREIANELYISAHTVKNHITKIFQKLHVSDRSQLMAMVYQLQAMKSS